MLKCLPEYVISRFLSYVVEVFSLYNLMAIWQIRRMVVSGPGFPPGPRAEHGQCGHSALRGTLSHKSQCEIVGGMDDMPHLVCAIHSQICVCVLGLMNYKMINI